MPLLAAFVSQLSIVVVPALLVLPPSKMPAIVSFSLSHLELEQQEIWLPHLHLLCRKGLLFLASRETLSDFPDPIAAVWILYSNLVCGANFGSFNLTSCITAILTLAWSSALAFDSSPLLLPLE